MVGTLANHIMTSGRHTVQQFKEAPAPTRATPAKSVARTNNQPSPTSPTTEKKRARTPAEPKPTPVPHSEWDERPDLSNTAGPYGHAPVLHIVSNKSFVVPDTSEGWDAAAGVVFDVATTVFGPAKVLGLGARLGARAINLPGWSKVTVDMVHVAQRHMLGGAKTAGRSIFAGMNHRGVMAAIQQAYGSAATVAVQGERVLLRGVTKTGLTVEMWLNKATKVIETAYPVVR